MTCAILQVTTPLHPDSPENHMSTTIKTLLFAGAFAVACGDSDDNNPDRGLNSSTPGVDEITVDVTCDVGNNLAIHFGRAAGGRHGPTLRLQRDLT